MTDKYFTEEEMLKAIEEAVEIINTKSITLKSYIRGVNDCFALFMQYDKALRGDNSKTKEVIDFSWDSTKEFVLKLTKKGYSLDKYAEYCGYEIIKNRKPKLGDAAFEDGAMLNNGNFWVSTDERNTGVINKKPHMFLETRATLIARPLRR